MSWEDRDEFIGRDRRDLMGVNSESLFADPLNVRAGSNRSQPPRSYGQVPAPQNYRQPQRAPSNTNMEDSALENEEEEDWNPITNFWSWMITGGKQCCSMRDRTSAQDIAAAKRASEIGRPPSQGKSVFAAAAPPVPERKRGLDSFKPPERPADERQPERPVERSPMPAYRGGDLSSSLLNQDSGRDEMGRRGWQQPSSSKSQEPERQPSSPRLHQPSSPRSQPQAPPSALPFPAPAPTPVPAPTSQPPAPVGSSGRLSSGGRLSAALSASAKIPDRWEWPKWAIDSRSPVIEVWVVDDDTGESRWIEGEPQSRVVDKTGRDAYLAVEYMWDNDYFVQDFGPQHVRRRGSKETVFDVFQKRGDGGDLDRTKRAPGRSGTGDLDQTKLAPGRNRGSGGDLEQTRLAPGRNRADNGGGVSAFLQA